MVWSLLQALDHVVAYRMSCLPRQSFTLQLACSGSSKFVVACIAEFLGVLLFTFSGSATPTGTISTQQSNTTSGKTLFTTSRCMVLIACTQ